MRRHYGTFQVPAFFVLTPVFVIGICVLIAAGMPGGFGLLIGALYGAWMGQLVPVHVPAGVLGVVLGLVVATSAALVATGL